jgi:hypothetical protein
LSCSIPGSIPSRCVADYFSGILLALANMFAVRIKVGDASHIRVFNHKYCTNFRCYVVWPSPPSIHSMILLHTSPFRMGQKNGISNPAHLFTPGSYVYPITESTAVYNVTTMAKLIPCCLRLTDAEHWVQIPGVVSSYIDEPVKPKHSNSTSQ